MRNRRKPRQAHLDRIPIFFMTKLCIFVGNIVFGYVFWFIADGLIGLDFFWAFVASGFGGVFGVWAGWKAAQTWFS